jgi:tRNA pseudouridine38-40 synthase
MLTTWRLTIEYDGRAFSGFQRQARDRSVQQTLEEALSRFFGGERIVVHGSGRTDAGVHALGQVVSFRAETPRDPTRVRLALNTMLPPDMACVSAVQALPAFHARMSAIGKKYRYVVLGRLDRSPFHTGRAWYVRQLVDWSAVEATLALFVGVHDFTAFRASSCNNPRPTREITRAAHLVRGQEHHLEFEGKGFLRYQVRIMVGTAIDVGMGRRTVAQVQEALATGARERAGRTAPPDGLYLVEVYYPPALLAPWTGAHATPGPADLRGAAPGEGSAADDAEDAGAPDASAAEDED